MKLVFATHNDNKIKEVQDLLGEKFEVKSLVDIGCHEDIVEDGLTFHENSLLKSEYIFKRFGLNAFADDSGLEVKSLNNEPGIYSARYSGSRDMNENINLLWEKLSAFEDKSAQFKTVISLILDGEIYYFEGVVKGKIIHEKRGENGFGYDPVFIPEGHERTFAEMSLEEKSVLSHRAKAVKKMVDFLLQL